MKFVKKITALFLAVTMVMAMGITAFAAETAKTYTISVGETDTHTYTVYQIFTGDLSTDASGNKVLSNLKAGSDYKAKKSTVAEDAADIQALTVTGQALANAISAYANKTTAFGTVSKGSALSGVPAGYYLIVDTTETLATGDSRNTNVVKVVEDVTVSVKRGTVEFEKKVQDINDSTDATAGDLQDSADYDIGDDVPFTLKGTVPANYADYTTYFYQFEDQMEPSLTFDENSVVVKIDGTVVDESSYSVAKGTVSSSDSYNGGDKFTITFEDLKNTAAKAGSNVVVTYNAKLNDKAVLGSTGNVNEAKLHYSNNPNQGGEGDKGETPWDAVIVFTYKVVVDKVDQEQHPLTGAEFTLYKVNASNEETVVKTWTMTPDTVGTKFTVTGLDDGSYVLKETKTPAGYNTIDPITFKVEANHDVTWTTQERANVLTSLTGNNTSGAVEFTADKTTGTLSKTVVNQKGSNLPSTGGMGTTILYVAGIALIVVAGVVVIARKRNA